MSKGFVLPYLTFQQESLLVDEFLQCTHFPDLSCLNSLCGCLSVYIVLLTPFAFQILLSFHEQLQRLSLLSLVVLDLLHKLLQNLHQTSKAMGKAIPSFPLLFKAIER